MPNNQIFAIHGGRDNRRAVPTGQSPYRAICRLTAPAGEGFDTVGTAFVIGSNRLVTAAHNFDDATNGPRSVTVTLPTGQQAVSDWKIHQNYWPQGGSKNSAFDFAVTVVPDNFLAGLQDDIITEVRTDQYLETFVQSGFNAQVPGYPTRLGRATNSKIQVTDNAKLVEVGPMLIKHLVDTTGGQSGAPVLNVAIGGGNYLLGIHTQGDENVYAPRIPNVGVRWTQAVKDWCERH
jgi:V8-like Glu-specific endopeptidase